MIWLIGSNNNIIGSEVYQVLKKNNIKFFFSNDEVNYTDYKLLSSITKDVNIKFIINLHTNDVNSKEFMIGNNILWDKKAELINKNILSICKEKNAVLITLSVNEVFSGSNFSGYTEEDTPQPLNSYGQYFYEYEQFLLSSYEKNIILRTSNLFGKFGTNYAYFLLKVLGGGGKINVVDDETFSPTYALDLAKVIVHLTLANLTSYGLYHCSNIGMTDWFTYSQTIFDLSIKYGILPPWLKSKAKLIPISHTEYGTEYKRPQHTVLICDKLSVDYKINMRSWEIALEDFFYTIQKNKEK